MIILPDTARKGYNTDTARKGYIRLRYFIPVVISRLGFEGVLPFPETIFPQITYSRSRQNPILKISIFPANSGKVRYPNEKVPSAYI